MTDDALPGNLRPNIGREVSVAGLTGSMHAVSQVEDSRDEELVLSIGTQDGRKVRLGLGLDVLVWWSLSDGTTRYRPYEVIDIRGGPFPTWVLRPAGPCSDGDRRATPRVLMAIPVGLVTPLGLVPGETTDLSEGGLRALFTPAPTAGFGESIQPFPEAGDLVTLAVVLGISRVELRCKIVQSRREADGRRLLRATFEELDQTARMQLRAATSQEIGRQVSNAR